MKPFKIGKVYCINTDYRVDRLFGQLTANALCAVPYGLCERFPVRLPTPRCPDNHNEVIRMMIDDGFTEWEWYLENDHFFHPTKSAGHWSKLSLLRHIAGREETAIFMTDPVYLKGFHFPTFEKSLNLLPDLEVLFLQYLVWHHLQGSIDAFYAQTPTLVPGIMGNFRNFGGSAIVLTPEGAAKMLQMWRDLPWLTMPEVTYEYGQQDGDMTGFYCCEPCMAHDIPIELGYPFATGDKSNHNTHYAPSSEDVRLPDGTFNVPTTSLNETKSYQDSITDPDNRERARLAQSNRERMRLI